MIPESGVELIDRLINYDRMPTTSAPAKSARSSRRRPGRPAGNPHADVRERLLDAATEFAIERGLDGASIREIADRADVSSAMIAYYFGDRRGLHEAMFQHALAAVTQQFEAALADPGHDEDIIDTLIRIHATAMSANPWLPRLIAREILGREEDFRSTLHLLVGEGPALMRSAITREVQRGTLRKDLDPVMCMLTILSLTAFPYLAGPVLGDQLGFELDDDFRDRLMAHNRDVIAKGLRAPTSGDQP